MGCRPQMIARAAIGVFLGILSFAFSAPAQCPSGFLDLGEVTATTAPGRYQEVKVTRELAVPAGIRIDDSYHQLSIQAASDGAASDMRAGEIPPGFQLVPGGQSGGAWWSIDKPELKQVDQGSSDPTHWVFRIDLYANSGGRGLAPAVQSGLPNAPSVRVRVCVKTRS
jgi:hypothetical protein